jgi:hypothetical protein
MWKITLNNLHQPDLLHYRQTWMQIAVKVTPDSNRHQSTISISNQTSLMELGHQKSLPNHKSHVDCWQTYCTQKTRYPFCHSAGLVKPKIFGRGNHTMDKTQLHCHWLHHHDIALLHWPYMVYKLYKHSTRRTSMFTLSLLHDALNHLDCKECLVALKLKAQFKMFEKDEQ